MPDRTVECTASVPDEADPNVTCCIYSLWYDKRTAGTYDRTNGGVLLSGMVVAYSYESCRTELCCIKQLCESGSGDWGWKLSGRQHDSSQITDRKRMCDFRRDIRWSGDSGSHRSAWPETAEWKICCPYVRCF